MLSWFARKTREHRATKYLVSYPDDEAAVQAILATLLLTPNATARDAAEMLAGRQLSDDEWNRFGARWERSWAAVAI